MSEMYLLRAESVSFAFPQAGYGLAPVSLQVEAGANTVYSRLIGVR